MALAERFGSAPMGRFRTGRASFPELLDETFDNHEREGRRLQLRGRSWSLAAVFVMIPFVAPYPEFFYYQALILVFIGTGFVPVLLERYGQLRLWHLYVFVALDFALMCFTVFYPNPLSPAGFPPQMALRFNTSIYLFLLLSSLAFVDQPKLVIWGGIVGAACWVAGLAWLATLPDSTIGWAPGEYSTPADMAEELARMASPTFVDTGSNAQIVVVFMLVALVLAAGVARSRRLVWRYAQIERQRLNLARHFPPATVDRLAKEDEPLGQIRELEAAVMFADLVGFTRWSERHTPAATIGLLREAHTLLEEAVFRHGGTLDKFMGDGIMATFGTPEPRPRDSLNALDCVKAILADVAALNAQRRARGEEPVQVAVGLHYGPVVVGNIGTERRLELAVIGDTVNAANRLEELTRVVGRTAVVSENVIADISERNGGVPAALLEDFDYLGPNQLQGRRQGMAVWASRETIVAAAESRAPRRPLRD